MIIKIEDTDKFYNQTIEFLKKGDVIAFPTDTIYGFAADGLNPDAVKKLAEIKGRDEKPFTLFMAKSKIEEYAIITKRKIIEYFIPGPLTVILKKRKWISLPLITEKIGIRIPQVDFIIKLLDLYDKPLAVTSANLSGQTPINSAVKIAERFTDVNLIIDGGELLSRPSTVLDLTTTPPVLKRKGTVPILEIEKVYGRNVMIEESLKFNVLFVCSGNTCRSPMAEGIFKTLINKKYCEVKSAGTLQMSTLSPAQNAQEVVEEYGGSILQHLTQTITKELIEWADLILVMEFKHYDTVLEMLPKAAVKTFLLKEYKRKAIYNQISDPVGKDINAYKEAARTMFPSLRFLVKDIKRRFHKEKD